MLSSVIVWVLGSTLGKAILKLVWDDMSVYLQNLIAKHQMIVDSKKNADASVKPLIDAKTGGDIEKASDSALNGL